MAEVERKRRPGKFGDIFSFIVSVFSLLVISIVLSIFIEWLGIVLGWWEGSHAQTMFDTEINWVLGDFLSNNTFYKETFIQFFKKSYYYLIRQTGIEYLSIHSNYLVEYIVSAVFIIQVVIVRLLIIICAIPAFFLITISILGDGLFIRELRKVSASKESSFIYHHAKRWIKPFIGLPIVLLLASPISIHPSIFILTVSLVPGFFIWTSVTYFKKYL